MIHMPTVVATPLGASVVAYISGYLRGGGAMPLRVGSLEITIRKLGRRKRR